MGKTLVSTLNNEFYSRSVTAGSDSKDADPDSNFQYGVTDPIIN